MHLSHNFLPGVPRFLWVSGSQFSLGLALILNSRPSLETLSTLSQKDFASFNVVKLNSDMLPSVPSKSL